MSEFAIRWGPPIVIMLIQGIFGWVLWSLRQRFVTSEKCSQNRATCECLSSKVPSRVEGLEKDIKSLPSSAELAELKVQLKALPDRSELEGIRESMMSLSLSIGKLEGRLGGLSRAVDLMNEHLINE